MNFNEMEFIQRAEDGGAPLSNEAAHELKIGHGTPMLVMPKRRFVAFLKRVKEAVTTVGVDYECVEELDALLKEHDQFVCEVDSTEIYENYS